MGFRAHERAPTLRGNDQPLGLQARNRAAYRRTARAVEVRQLMFGGQALTRRPAACQDLCTKLVHDPLVGERLPYPGHNLILQVARTRTLKHRRPLIWPRLLSD